MLKGLKNIFIKLRWCKAFSIEGVDALVPMLQRTITIAAKEGIKNIQIGMAHRGRLNVLTHVLENRTK